MDLSVNVPFSNFLPLLIFRMFIFQAIVGFNKVLTPVFLLILLHTSEEFEGAEGLPIVEELLQVVRASLF